LPKTAGWPLIATPVSKNQATGFFVALRQEFEHPAQQNAGERFGALL
jgi:hypothetical protein